MDVVRWDVGATSFVVADGCSWSPCGRGRNVLLYIRERSVGKNYFDTSAKNSSFSCAIVELVCPRQRCPRNGWPSRRCSAQTTTPDLRTSQVERDTPRNPARSTLSSTLHRRQSQSQSRSQSRSRSQLRRRRPIPRRRRCPSTGPCPPRPSLARRPTPSDIRSRLPATPRSSPPARHSPDCRRSSMSPPKNIAASAPSTENETTADTPTSTTTVLTSVHGPHILLLRLAPLPPPTQTHSPPLPRPSNPLAVARLAPAGAPNTDSHNSTRNTPTPTSHIPPVVWHTRAALSRHPRCTPKARPFSLTLSLRRHDIHHCTRYYHTHKHLHSRRDIYPCIVTVAHRPSTASAHREWPEVCRC